MNARGFTLVELLIGSAIAGIVGAMALAVLWRSGVVTVRTHTRLRGNDDAWLALAAISRDLRAARTWQGCSGSTRCASGTAHRPSTAIVAGRVQWFADDGLWRCERPGEHGDTPWACARFLEDISAVTFTADIAKSDGVMERREFVEGDGDSAEAINVTVWTAKGTPYSRATGRHERAH